MWRVRCSRLTKNDTAAAATRGARMDFSRACSESESCLSDRLFGPGRSGWLWIHSSAEQAEAQRRRGNGLSSTLADHSGQRKCRGLINCCWFTSSSSRIECFTSLLSLTTRNECRPAPSNQTCSCDFTSKPLRCHVLVTQEGLSIFVLVTRLDSCRFVSFFCSFLTPLNPESRFFLPQDNDEISPIRDEGVCRS